MDKITVEIDVEKIENIALEHVLVKIKARIEEFLFYDAKPIIKESINRLAEAKISETVKKLTDETDLIYKECRQEYKNKIMRQLEKISKK
jgi:hypothetical protein